MTNTTHESEAMEVHSEAAALFDRALLAYEAMSRRQVEAIHAGEEPGDYNPAEAAARVIAPALEARDARIADYDAAYLALSSFFNEEQAECRAAHARIAELEGALAAAREKIAGHPFIGVNAAKELLAILTKGKTHD